MQWARGQNMRTHGTQTTRDVSASAIKTFGQQSSSQSWNDEVQNTTRRAKMFLDASEKLKKPHYDSWSVVRKLPPHLLHPHRSQKKGWRADKQHPAKLRDSVYPRFLLRIPSGHLGHFRPGISCALCQILTSVVHV